MKKYIVITSLLVLCIWSISGALETKAQENGTAEATNPAVQELIQEEDVSYQELETETPKLLPNNPFYFIKNLGWGIRRAITFNPVKKAELELKIINEKAAELKRLEETDSANTKALEKAIVNYQNNVERLRDRLETLKETSENPNIDKLLDKLTDRSVKHQQLFDNLLVKMENRPAIKEKLEDIKDRVDDVIVKIPEKFEDAAKFKERVEKIIQQHPRRTFKELRAVGFIDRIEEKLPEDRKEQLQNLKEKLISDFENHIEKLKEIDKEKLLNPEVLKNLPGDNLRRLNILERVHEKLTDPSLKEEILEVREELIERVDQDVGRERILKLIEEAKSLIAKAENSLSEDLDSSIIQSAKTLIEISKKHLIQAEEALSMDKIGEAFGQANSAVSTVKNALRQIQHRDIETGTTTLPIKPKPLPIKPKPSPVCIQVITPAISPEGVCKNFPTPCDVPLHWEKVSQCPTATSSSNLAPSAITQ